MAKPSHPEFSLPSILAILAAIFSFFVEAGWGLLFALLAIILGAIGILMAASSRIRGGFISILSVVAGLIGIITAVLKLIF